MRAADEPEVGGKVLVLKPANFHDDNRNGKVVAVPADIKDIVCETAEGILHRLWEPLADKQRPANGYAAKFSMPYLIAAGLVREGKPLSRVTRIRPEISTRITAKTTFSVNQKLGELTVE